MNSTSIPKRTDPNEMMIARLEKANARAYEQFADKVTHADGRLSNPAHDAAYQPSDDPQTSVNKFRPAVAADRVPSGRPTRLFFGLLLIASVGVTILLWRASYSDAAKQLIAGWASHPAPAQDRAKVTPPPEDNAPTTVLQAAELAQLLQTIARNLATVVQGIEQLKTSQDQLARNNAKYAEQLKANQEQTARDNAKIIEQLEASQEQMVRVLARASKRNPQPAARTARPD
jgi:hypothetical protein